MKENWIVCLPLGINKVYCPLASVIVPLFEPFSMTVAPIKKSLVSLSVTTPVIVAF